MDFQTLFKNVILIVGWGGQEVGCCFPVGTVRKDFNETRVELFGNALQHVSSPKCASLPLLAPLICR